MSITKLYTLGVQVHRLGDKQKQKLMSWVFSRKAKFPLSLWLSHVQLLEMQIPRHNTDSINLQLKNLCFKKLFE